MKRFLVVCIAALMMTPAALANVQQDSAQYFKAFVAGDYKTACDLTSDVFFTSNKLSPKQCPSAMLKALGKKPSGHIVGSIVLTRYALPSGTAYGVIAGYADGHVNCNFFVSEKGRYRFAGATQGGCPNPASIAKPQKASNRPTA
jgi:hypothetical protein